MARYQPLTTKMHHFLCSEYPVEVLTFSPFRTPIRFPTRRMLKSQSPHPVPAKNAGTRVGHPIHRLSIAAGFARLDSRGGCPYTNNYTRPWSSMALATFRKPPMLAPFTRLPGVPYFSAVSKQFR